MLGYVANTVTMLFMPKKQIDSPGKWPNGLADAIARIKLIDPDMGPTKLAKLTNKNKQTMARYIAQERKLPAFVAAEIAPHVKSTVAELLQIETDAPTFEKVPLISWVSAGRLSDEDGVSNVDIDKYVIAVDLPKGDWWAMRVKGNSMDRIAPDGSVIFLNRKDKLLREDQFYVFALGTGPATFKRYRGDRGRVRLQPYSSEPDHETIPAPPDLRVIGRVRRVVTDLR